MEYVMGVVPSKRDVRDYKLDRGVCTVANYPEYFALDLVPVKNQGSKPTCAAHAGAEIAEYYYQSQHGSYKQFSTEWIYGTREADYYVGNGMSLRDVLVTLYKYGDVFYEVLPGNNDYQEAMKNVAERRDELLEESKSHRITAYFTIHGIDEMKKALTEYGYLLVSMPIYEGDKCIGGDYRSDPKSKYSGNHAVVIYGWYEKGWLVQNSWGAAWGKLGRFTLPFDFKFNEVWGTADEEIEDGEFKKPFRTKFAKIFARIFNFIINLFKRRTLK